MALQRYKITIAYDGTDFHGWQAQAPAGPGAAPLRTVQGVLTEALQITLQQRIGLKGASRTDAGVHAIGQVAAFDADTRIPLERLAMAINSRLPDDVEVRDAMIVHPTFDATRDAIDKQYRYRLWTSRRRPVHLRRMVQPCRHAPLDIAAMNDAAARIVGEHDFAAFATSGHGRLSTVRTVHACSVEFHPADPIDGQGFISGDEVHIVVRGGGFLYNMVRIIAGTLVEVGRGHWTPGYIDHLLSNPHRELAGPTLPARGLCLEWIAYPPPPPREEWDKLAAARASQEIGTAGLHGD